MEYLALLAQRNADHPENRWLEDNPLILGLIILALGAAIIARGSWELYTGVSRDRAPKH